MDPQASQTDGTFVFYQTKARPPGMAEVLGMQEMYGLLSLTRDLRYKAERA